MTDQGTTMQLIMIGLAIAAVLLIFFMSLKFVNLTLRGNRKFRLLTRLRTNRRMDEETKT